MKSVDVIIPFHSDSSFLWKALDSILLSKGVAVRLLLINDIGDQKISSKFQKEIETYLDRVSANYLIISNDGRSYATSLNAGRAFLESDFVAILNSDDLSTPLRLQSQVRALEESCADLAVGRIVKFSRRFRLPTMVGKVKPSSFCWQHILLGAYGADASIMVTRKAWLEFFRFDESNLSSDWATALRIYPQIRIIGVDSAVYKYRIHSLQVTQSKIQISDEFSLYFPLWNQLNTALGLPDVPQRVAQAISQPWAKLKLEKSDFKLMQIWCAKFESVLSDISEPKQTRSLLSRRLIISGQTYFGIIKNPFLFTKMVMEYTYIRIIGARTRSR
mgnify:CR=1 FL=1